jgi:hypothetical protein
MNTPKFTFHRDGVPEEVKPERWCWTAFYNDNTLLKQFDEETGLFHQFKEIDQAKLEVFRMEKDDKSRHYDLVFNPAEMKLIHFYTVTHLRNDKYVFTTYWFGYEKNIRGVADKHLMAILPTDEFVICDDQSKVRFDLPENVV